MVDMGADTNEAAKPAEQKISYKENRTIVWLPEGKTPHQIAGETLQSPGGLHDMNLFLGVIEELAPEFSPGYDIRDPEFHNLESHFETVGRIHSTWIKYFDAFKTETTTDQRGKPVEIATTPAIAATLRYGFCDAEGTELEDLTRQEVAYMTKTGFTDIGQTRPVKSEQVRGLTITAKLTPYELRSDDPDKITTPRESGNLRDFIGDFEYNPELNAYGIVAEALQYGSNIAIEAKQSKDDPLYSSFVDDHGHIGFEVNLQIDPRRKDIEDEAKDFERFYEFLSNNREAVAALTQATQNYMEIQRTNSAARERIIMQDGRDVANLLITQDTYLRDLAHKIDTTMGALKQKMSEALGPQENPVN